MRGRTLTVSALCLLALMAGGCMSARRDATVPADAAKVLVRYRWTMADTKARPAGFNVLAGSTAAGPFERLNEQPIVPANPAEGETVTLAVDYAPRLGQTRWYYVERLDAQGRAVKVADAVSARAVLPLLPEDRTAYLAWAAAHKGPAEKPAAKRPPEGTRR